MPSSLKDPAQSGMHNLPNDNGPILAARWISGALIDPSGSRCAQTSSTEALGLADADLSVFSNFQKPHRRQHPRLSQSRRPGDTELGTVSGLRETKRERPA